MLEIKEFVKMTNLMFMLETGPTYLIWCWKWFFNILISRYSIIFSFYSQGMRIQNSAKNERKITKFILLFYLVKNEKIQQKTVGKEDYWQNPENFFFQGRSILEGKIQKMQKNILFHKNLSERLFLMVIWVKLKVDGTKVVSVFEFGPYFGSKWLFLSFLTFLCETNVLNMAFIGT